MYEADMDPAHLNIREERFSASDTRRRPWRPRNAHLIERHVELDEVRTTRQTDNYEGTYVRRLTRRHMSYDRCWAAAVAAGSESDQERAVARHNNKGRGHVIA